MTHPWALCAALLVLSTACAQKTVVVMEPAATSGTAETPQTSCKSVIAKIIKDNLDSFESCYQIELKRKPTLQGRVTTTFVISPDGEVTKVGIRKTTLHDLPTETCILHVLSKLRFPPQKNGVVEATYPFLFRQAQ